jgi:hypothetical protein
MEKGFLMEKLLRVAVLGVSLALLAIPAAAHAAYPGQNGK